MNTFLRICLICATLTLRADLPEITIEKVASYVYQDGNENRPDIGYFGFILEVTALEDDVYLSSEVDGSNGASWTIISFLNEEVTGEKSAALTTVNAPVYQGFFGIRAGDTERFTYSFSLENDGEDAFVQAVLIDLKFSAEPNGAVTTVSLDNFKTHYVFVDGNPVVPEPGSFTLLALGLVALRKLMK